MKTTIEILGKGGDGAKTLARIIGEAAVLDGKNCSFYPVYDAVVRGTISDGKIIGASNAYIIISDEKIINPIVEKKDINIILNLNGENGIAINDEIAKNKKLLGIFLVGAFMAVKILEKESLITAIKNNISEEYCVQNLKALEAGITATMLNK